MIEMEDEQEAALRGAISGPTSYRWEDPQVYYQTQYRILTGREQYLANGLIQVLYCLRHGNCRKLKSKPARHPVA